MENRDKIYVAGHRGLVGSAVVRRLQADGAFRRWSSALSDLKRARDQLRNPVEVLGQIVSDASEMVDLTQLLADQKSPLLAEEPVQGVPAWLTK